MATSTVTTSDILMDAAKASDAVPREVARSGAVTKGASQATYVVVSVVVATLVFLFGVGGALWLYSGDPATGIGVGLFTAFWGGPGFGLMGGMALYHLRVEQRAGRH